MNKKVISGLGMLFSVLFSFSVFGQLLTNLVDIQGIRDNQLVGYSLVVGLDGSGDKNQVRFTNQSVTNMLRQFGVQLPERIDPKVKNVAAVAISATLPPMYSRGQTIDVTVSSIGDAKSLRGGTLLLTQLRGADGEVYAIAQGQVVVGGINVEGRSGSSVTINTPTVGRIPNGATVEREIPSDFLENEEVILNLKRPNFKTATNIVETINKVFAGNLAEAFSPTNIVVKAPPEPTARIKFMAMLQELKVDEGPQPAKIIFNAKTGTIVIGEGVVVRPAAVTHGNLMVTIRETQNVSQPAPFAEGNTAVTPESQIEVVQNKVPMIVIPEATKLKTIVDTINRLGAGTDDIMAILQALHEAGALDAELVVI